MPRNEVSFYTLALSQFNLYNRCSTSNLLIGLSLAWAEMHLVLCNLLFQFDIKLRPECENWIEQDLFFIWEKGTLMVELTRRE